MAKDDYERAPVCVETIQSAANQRGPDPAALSARVYSQRREAHPAQAKAIAIDPRRTEEDVTDDRVGFEPDERQRVVATVTNGVHQARFGEAAERALVDDANRLTIFLAFRSDLNRSALICSYCRVDHEAQYTHERDARLICKIENRPVPLEGEIEFEGASSGWRIVMQTTLERLRGEFLEMPGLCLTEKQVCRLCGVNPVRCKRVLHELVDENFLCVRENGMYVRVTDDVVLHAQLVNVSHVDYRSRQSHEAA
jgi:hypothetical protein